MFSLALPLALLLLPLPLIIKKILPKDKKIEKPALVLPFYQQIEKAISLTDNQNRQKSGLLWGLWIFLVIALAGPIWIGDKQVIHREGRNILLAIDVSGSMELDDMKLNNQRVDRLTVVKDAAHHFINQREGDRLGLILFGTKAYLQTPLTYDLNTVGHMVDDATIGLAGQTTSIGDAIGLAIKKLSHVKGKNKVLILLTDGANNSGVLNPELAAKIAKEKHIKIYTIGLGSTKMIVQNIFGLQAVNPSSDLDEKTLKAIAKKTGGSFFRAKDAKALNNIYQTINQLEPSLNSESVYRPIKEYYVYPLSIAILFYFLLISPSQLPKRIRKKEAGAAL